MVCLRRVIFTRSSRAASLAGTGARGVAATGAGDSAVAGLLAALLRGADLATAADYACAVGAQNVQAVDPVSGVRSWEQTTAQLSGPRVPPAVVLD